MSVKKRYGVMGGTFDPIHFGHLMVAETAAFEYKLEKVFFIPSANPPHKVFDNITEFEKRYVMVKMAIASNVLFEVLDLERNKEEKAYTVDTLKNIHEKVYHNSELYFITGMDSVYDLPNWREPKKILELCYFVAAKRPGYDFEIKNTFEKLGEIAYRKVCFLEEALEFPISSTEIRERIKKGKTIKYLLPESVEKYIYDCGLYL